MQKRKVKICWVTNIDKSARFILFSYLKFLKKEGFDICVVYSPGEFAEEIERAGIRVKKIRIKRNITPLYDLISIFNLWKFFRQERFDIVHTHTPKAGLLGQLSAKIAGVPIVVNTIHGFYFQNTDSKLKKKFFILIEKIAAKFSDLIFFVNREDMETAQKQKICNKERMKYFGGGINVARFSTDFLEKETVLKKKKELNISADRKIVGIVARLVKEKGYLDLFKAFRSVLKKYPEALLLIIGPEEPEKRDKINIKIIRNYGIGKNVLYLGERQDINELYALMNVFVLPSYREGLGISLLEAQSMEKPVIGTDIRGCREAVRNGETGILVPPRDPAKLGEAIIYLLSNYDKAKKMGEAGRKMILSEFDERIVFDRIKKAYEGLLNKKLKQY